MKHTNFKKVLLQTSLFIVFFLTAFVGTAKAGLDYYEIFIGQKLIFKRALNEPLNLASLPISQVNSNEQLIVYYYQCNAPDKLGINRIITLKDANANKVKEWKFADAKGSNTGMNIPIKELLQLQKTSKNSLALFYAAKGREDGEKIASVAAGNKTTGFLDIKNADKSYEVALLFFMNLQMMRSI